MLEANIDDMNAEFYGYLLERAFEMGALDVFFTPIIMKKNRPAVKLSVLCDEEHGESLEKLIFNETTTLGIRKYNVDRSVLQRKSIGIETMFGDVSIKVGYMDGEVIKYAPEYEECRRIAKSFNIPLRKVYEEISHRAEEYLKNNG